MIVKPDTKNDGKSKTIINPMYERDASSETDGSSNSNIAKDDRTDVGMQKKQHKLSCGLFYKSLFDKAVMLSLCLFVILIIQPKIILFVQI